MIKSLQVEVQRLYNNENYNPGHDIKHVLRVVGLSAKIARAEGYNVEEAKAAALLHDMGRFSSNTESHAEEGVKKAQELLNSFTEFNPGQKNRILNAIANHSKRETADTLTHILQDADKLDGLGAVGIMKAFIAESHLPDYIDVVSTEVRSPYPLAKTLMEQLGFQLEWYDMLYTKTAKKIGQRRFTFMKEFVSELKREVEESKID